MCKVVKTPIFVKTCNFFVEIVVKKAKMGVFTPIKSWLYLLNAESSTETDIQSLEVLCCSVH